MPLPSSRSSARSINAWPGWVDALSSLIMVIIFLLMVFVLAQFYLATALTGRDQALQQLNTRIAELGDLLDLERRSSDDLRANVAKLTAELQGALVAKEEATRQLTVLLTERDEMAGRLTVLTDRAAVLERTAKELEDANKIIAADKETIELKLHEIASLQADLAALREAREKAEAELATLAAERARTGETLRLTEEERKELLAEVGGLRDRSKELEAKLAEAEERTVLAQKDIEARDIRIDELMAATSTTQAALDEQQKLTTESQRQVMLLNQQIDALKGQIARLNTVLEASEAKNREQEVQIFDLGKRLNAALATKVEELARYRSEFFGRLREVLGQRQDIRIVGDRFVFQSEVLFPTASAVLQEQGKDKLAELARTLLDIAGKIPSEVNWVLRVDGHTDRRPIATAQFPSNWELSMARAMSVVRFLIDQGIPAERLAAAGFGEFQPLDGGGSEEAYSRNRRIEIKFDQR
ncbi:MAG TPA: peptidoglycan -binding protein [Azospirillaceae bacterium]|nr:peptidoglycan -binding protein [Azospirillaceae bacterium]